MNNNYLENSVVLNYLYFTVMYKYMSVDDQPIVKKVVQNEYISKSDAKFRKIYMRACNPADSIIRGSEGNSFPSFCYKYLGLLT